jgi:GTPase
VCSSDLIVDDGRRKYTWAELPALGGSSQKGRSLGTRFLRHAARAKVLVYLVDAGLPEIEDQAESLMKASAQSDLKLGEKKSVIAVNKIDLVTDTASLDSAVESLRRSGPFAPVLTISVEERTGLRGLVEAVHGLAEQEGGNTMESQLPAIVFRPRPVDQRK